MTIYMKWALNKRVITNTSSFACFACSATSPSFTYVSNPAPDSSLCRAATPHLRPLQLLFPDCGCCSPIASTSTAPRLLPLQLLLPDCIHFNCSPIASASAVAPRLHPLQLLPDCVHFSCCSPIASASAVLPQLFQPMPNVPEHSSQSSRFSKLKYECRVLLV